jgi:hypothetical protein
VSRRTGSANAHPGLSSYLAIPAQTNDLDNAKNVRQASIRPDALGADLIHPNGISAGESDIWHATKLAAPLAAPSPGLRFTLEPDIKLHRSADKILQSRLIDVLAFVDVNGAPEISFEAGVEQT